MMAVVDAVWKIVGFVALTGVLLVPFAAFLIFAWLVLPPLCAYEAIYGKTRYPKLPERFGHMRRGKIH